MLSRDSASTQSPESRIGGKRTYRPPPPLQDPKEGVHIGGSPTGGVQHIYNPNEGVKGTLSPSPGRSMSAHASPGLSPSISRPRTSLGNNEQQTDLQSSPFVAHHAPYQVLEGTPIQRPFEGVDSRHVPPRPSNSGHSPVNCRPARSATPSTRLTCGSQSDRGGYMTPNTNIQPSSSRPNTVMSPPPNARGQPLKFSSNCGILVREIDPVTKRCVATFRCGEKLGEGGFGKVFDFVDIDTNERYACKIIDKKMLEDKSNRQKFFAEIDIHRRLKHPNILEFKRHFEDQHYYYLILERCCNQSLMDVHQERIILTVEEIQSIFIQLLSATAFMHSKRIIHRDLKLGNIMIDAYGNMKVGDFGFAAELKYDDEKKRTLCGTPNYIAPEVLRAPRPNSPGYSYSADTWSLGVILYTLAVGKPPFETKEVSTTYELIKRCQYSFPAGTLTHPPFPIPPLLKEMVWEMLQLNPEDRSSLVALRNHRFLRGAPSTVPRSLANLDAAISPCFSPVQEDQCHSPCGTGFPECSPRRQESNSVRRLSSQIDAMTLINQQYQQENIEGHSTGAKCAHAISKMPASVTNYTHFPKYGWCYHIVQDDGRHQLGVTLNDRTKLVYDEETEELWCFHRERKNNRYIDEPYFFKSEAEALDMAKTEAGIQMTIVKKISILRFLRNYMQKQDPLNLPAVLPENNDGSSIIVHPTAALYNLKSLPRKTPRPETVKPPEIVKDIIPHVYTKHRGLPPHCKGSGVAIRLSNLQYQHSLTVRECNVEDCIGIAYYGPCMPPWSIDFMIPSTIGRPTSHSGMSSVIQITFASHVNSKCITVNIRANSLIDYIRHQHGVCTENNIMEPFRVGALKLPHWVCTYFAAFLFADD